MFSPSDRAVEKMSQHIHFQGYLRLISILGHIYWQRDTFPTFSHLFTLFFLKTSGRVFCLVSEGNIAMVLFEDISQNSTLQNSGVKIAKNSTYLVFFVLRIKLLCLGIHSLLFSFAQLQLHWEGRKPGRVVEKWQDLKLLWSHVATEVWTGLRSRASNRSHGVRQGSRNILQKDREEGRKVSRSCWHTYLG